MKQLPFSRRVPLGLSVAFAAGVAMSACGAQVSNLDHACPCESGWTCCSDNVCVPPGAGCGSASDAAANAVAKQCPTGIELGNATLPTFGPDGDVEPFPPSLSMNGQVLAVFPKSGGATMKFDYAASAQLQGGRVTQQGWMIQGGNTQKFQFKVWAQDGNVIVPLQLVVYGPIELGPSGNDCFGTLVGSGPMAITDTVFGPPTWGQYFVTAYHPLEVQTNGTVSIQSVGGADLSQAQLSMDPIGD